jgi:hypothetical protein
LPKDKIVLTFYSKESIINCVYTLYIILTKKGETVTMKKIIIAIVAALTVCAGTATGATVYMNQPEVVARNAMADAIEGFFEREEVAPLLNMVTEGSLEVNAKSSIEDEGVPAWLKDAEAGGKIYFSENALMVEGLFAKADDIDLSADAYLSDDLIYVTNDDILGGSWGVIRGEMAEAFEDSELIEMIGMPTEAEDAVLEVLEAYDNKMGDDLRKDIEKYTEKYLKVVIKAIEDNAKYESEGDEVKVGGERINARVITITIDAEAAAAIAEDIYDELKDDKNLRKTVIEYANEFETSLVAAGVIGEDEDFGDVYDEFIDELGDNIDSMDEDDDGEVVIEIVTPKLSSKMLKLSVINKYDGGKSTLLTIDVGEEGMKDSQRIAVSRGSSTSIIYEIEENTSKEYTASLKSKSGSETVTLCKLSIDKSEDTFKITVPEADANVSGKWESKGKTTTITVNKIRVDEVTIDDFEVTLIIKEKDNMPNPESKKNIKNILSITEEDIEEIGANAEEFFGFGFSSDKEAVDTILPNYDHIIPDYSEDVYNGEAVLPKYEY